MAQAEFGELLQFVRRPMAEIQRSGGAELERIAGSRNVVKVQLGATINQALHGCGLEFTQPGSVAFEGLKKIPVTNQRYLNGLDITRSLVAWRKRRQQLKIVNDGKGWSKGADEVFFAEGVDAVFHTDARVGLAESGRGQSDMPDSAMGRGGRQAHDVQ